MFRDEGCQWGNDGASQGRCDRKGTRALLMFDVGTFYSTSMGLGVTSFGAPAVSHSCDANAGVGDVADVIRSERRSVGADGERR